MCTGQLKVCDTNHLRQALTAEVVLPLSSCALLSPPACALGPLLPGFLDIRAKYQLLLRSQTLVFSEHTSVLRALQIDRAQSSPARLAGSVRLVQLVLQPAELVVTGTFAAAADELVAMVAATVLSVVVVAPVAVVAVVAEVPTAATLGRNFAVVAQVVGPGGATLAVGKTGSAALPIETTGSAAPGVRTRTTVRSAALLVFLAVGATRSAALAASFELGATGSVLRLALAFGTILAVRTAPASVGRQAAGASVLLSVAETSTFASPAVAVGRTFGRNPAATAVAVAVAVATTLAAPWQFAMAGVVAPVAT